MDQNYHKITGPKAQNIRYSVPQAYFCFAISGFGKNPEIGTTIAMRHKKILKEP
jgi:hypothetical protein